jgi:hypothetical protein
MTGYYTYYYYLLKQLEYILNSKINNSVSELISKEAAITAYKNKVLNILSLLDEFKDINHDNLKLSYETELNIIFSSKITTLVNLEKLFNKIDENIKYCTKEIKIDILNNSQIKLLNNIYKTKTAAIAAKAAADRLASAAKVAADANPSDVTKAEAKLEADKKVIYANDVQNSFQIIPIYTSGFEQDATKIIDLPYNNINYKIIYKNYTKGDLVVRNKYELPYLIVNDDGDEFYLKISNATGNLHVISSDITATNKIKFIINSRYKPNSTNILIDTLADNIWSTTPNNLTNIYSIPIILNKIADDDTKIELFKKIILAVLFNGICNIQSKFENKELFDKIKIYKTPVIEFQLNKIYIMPYIVSFIEEFITLDNKDEAKILLNNTDNYISFYILLFNAYNSQFIDIKKTINTNINYLMNNSKKIINTTTIINILYDIINYKLLSDEIINSDNSDFNKDDDIIKLYNNNKPIINLIIALFENLLITIKTTINKSSYSSLCYPPSTSRLIIQDAINKKFDAIAPVSAATSTGYNTISKALVPGNDRPTIILIDELNNILRYYFNIVIFLLDNLKLNTNTAEIDAITNNFNFYNRDDNIKNIIQKQLIISCDYYSKYNNMDSKQLSYFKINADNVNYNFPILMIIFLIILGEPIFIKS